MENAGGMVPFRGRAATYIAESTINQTRLATPWSSGFLNYTGDVIETVDFTLPAGLTAPGNYSVEVIGAGITSSPVFLDITAAEIAGL